MSNIYTYTQTLSNDELCYIADELHESFLPSKPLVPSKGYTAYVTNVLNILENPNPSNEERIIAMTASFGTLVSVLGERLRNKDIPNQEKEQAENSNLH